MEQPTFYTDRLKIRPLQVNDIEGMYELDSNPKVHKYLGGKTVATIEESKEVIEFIRMQYVDNGIGRWAVEEKDTGNFVGWTGFKRNTEIINRRKEVLDLGYRFLEKFWGKGYATETAIACMEYGFNTLNFEVIHGMADVRHKASNKILKKAGLKYINTFNFEGEPHYFYEVSKEDWLTEFLS